MTTVRKLTVDEIRMLADIERRMDNGEQPYVLVDGSRMAVEPDIMKELGLVKGQTISKTIALAVREACLVSLKMQLDLERVISKNTIS